MEGSPLVNLVVLDLLPSRLENLTDAVLLYLIITPYNKCGIVMAGLLPSSTCTSVTVVLSDLMLIKFSRSSKGSSRNKVSNSFFDLNLNLYEL